MKKLSLFRIRWAILVLLLAGVLFVRYSAGLGEVYARHIYPNLSFVLSWSVSWIPFSLCETLVLCAAIVCVAYPFYARYRKIAWRSIIVREIEWLLWIYVWFYWAWGLNYFRSDFYSRASVTPAVYSEQEFRRFLTEYTLGINQTYSSCSLTDVSEMQREIKSGFNQIPVRYGLTLAQTFQKPKYSLVNALYSKVGVLGYMGPFFAESHVNRDLLSYQYPFVYAHELSHLLGTSSEAEANFWAYKVCTHSSNPLIRYSGYFGILPYVLSNAHDVLPENVYRRWVNSIRPEVLQHLSQADSYWSRRYSRLLGKMQSVIYEYYLKGNRISSGQKNYAEVVEMILSVPS